MSRWVSTDLYNPPEGYSTWIALPCYVYDYHAGKYRMPSPKLGRAIGTWDYSFSMIVVLQDLHCRSVR